MKQLPTKESTMIKNNITKKFLLIITLTVATLSAQADLTKQSINSFVKQIDEATHQKNINFIKDKVSENAEFTIMVGEVVNDQNNIKLTKKQYITQVSDFFKVIQDYKSKTKIIVIEISEDKTSAVVVSTIHEEMKIKGEVFVQRNKQVLRLIEKAGKIEVTDIIVKLLDI